MTPMSHTTCLSPGKLTKKLGGIVYLSNIKLTTLVSIIICTLLGCSAGTGVNNNGRWTTTGGGGGGGGGVVPLTVGGTGCLWRTGTRLSHEISLSQSSGGLSKFIAS